MKIFAFAGNYASEDTEGAEEDPLYAVMRPRPDGDPVWFGMPDSAETRNRKPVFVPDFDADFRLLPTVIYLIGKLGKGMPARFADRYIEAAGIGAALVAADTLRRLSAAGLPWERAVAFDRSCLCGNLEPPGAFIEYGPLEIKCGGESLTYDPARLIRPVDRLIEYLGRDHTLKNGDLLLAGLHPHGLPAVPGTRLTAFPAKDRNGIADQTDNNLRTLIDIPIR